MVSRGLAKLRPDRFWIAAAALVMLLFVANVGDHLVARTLCCADDTLPAVAAKNLATGQGYASSYRPDLGGGNVPFDPGVTTGPVLVVPAALAIRVFGNRYWVPGAVTALLSLGLLGLAFRQLATATGDPRRWAPAVAVALVALNLATIGFYEQWYAMLGEVPALLLLVVAVPGSVAAGRGWRRAAWGGLFLGLAVQCKAFAAIPALVAIPAFGLTAARDAGSSPEGDPHLRPGVLRLRRGVAAAVLAGLFFALPSAAFELGKLTGLGWAGYLELKVEEARFFRSIPQSGLSSLSEAGAMGRLRETLARNERKLPSYFGGRWAEAAFAAAVALVLAARRRWTGRESPIPLVLAAMASGLAAWWLTFSTEARLRHLLIAFGLACFAVVFDLFLDRWSWRKLALAAAFAAALAPRAEHLAWIKPPRPYFQPSPRVAALLAARDYLEANRAGRVIAADWWASGCDMEYLLAGTGNLVHHQALERLGPTEVLFYESSKWIDWARRGRERWQAALERHGAALVFEKDPYRIYAAPPPAEDARP